MAWRVVYCLAFVVVCCFSAGRCGVEPRSVDVRGVSCLAFVVASHAVLTWRAGEGGGLILPALAKSAPTLPSPPRHPGTARCAACGCAGRNAGCFCSSLHRWPACSFFRVTPHSGAGAHGIARARGEPFRQSLLAVCGGRLTPCSGAERSSVSPNQQSEGTPPQLGTPPTRGHTRSIAPAVVN